MSAKYFRDASNNYLGATSGEVMAGGIEVATAPSDARMVLANGAWGLPAGVSPTTDALVGSEEITFITNSMYNCTYIIRGGKLYSAIGDSGSHSNHTSGFGLDATIDIYGIENLREVTFPSQPTGTTVVQAGGDGYTVAFALLSNGYLYTWGRNSSGALGLGNTTAQAVPVLALTDCVEVYDDNTWGSYSVTNANLFVKRANGWVYAAGDNNYGEFGLGNRTQFNSFRRLPWIGTNPIFVSASEGYVGRLLIQKSDGTIWTVGWGGNGVRFDSSTNHITTATDVTAALGGSGAGDVIFSHYTYSYHSTATGNVAYSLVVRKDGSNVTRLFTVGNGSAGQLGNGSTTTITVPYEVPNMGDIAQITLNGGGVPAIHVLKTNGDLYCWGRNSEGQLGVGNTALTSSPTLVTTGVAEIMSKSFVQHTYEFRIQVFIRKGTDIYCTGYNNVYQLGLGYTTAVNTFTLNPLLSNAGNRVKFIGRTTSSTSKATMVAVLENNDIMAWGNGGNQSIFNDSNVHVRYPLKINWEV